ncbi:GxxExxY protein [Rubellicoccus peritrichatus]|uniref:GxxExxY protein n=1 Tax=Rubellicoccus peritrichatus TaxID=3080537 RepID=UPI0031F306F7
MLEEDLTEKIIGAAIEVHKYWGPGLNESIYELSLCQELSMRGLSFEHQHYLPLIYKDVRIGDDLRLDLWVEKKVVVENKCISNILPVHESQLLTYMRLTKSRVGLLINYHVPVLTKGGIKRMVL